jgi:hypothetical protein
LRGRFGAGGIDRADGHIIRARRHRAFGLSRRVRAQSDLNPGGGVPDFLHAPVARIEEIFLAEMTNLRANLAGDVEMIVDDQRYARAMGDGVDGFRQTPDFVGRRRLGAQLNEIRAAVAQLAGELVRCATMQISGIHESVEATVSERFHA